MKQTFSKILESVGYPGFQFVVRGDHGGLYMQIKCDATCNVTGAPMLWKGRKWRLSNHMTKSEVVQTAFKAVLTAIEHEVREKFLYRGASVFDPHYDVDKLFELRVGGDALDVRKEVSDGEIYERGSFNNDAERDEFCDKIWDTIKGPLTSLETKS